MFSIFFSDPEKLLTKKKLKFMNFYMLVAITKTPLRLPNQTFKK